MRSWTSVVVYELRWLPRRLGGWRGIALYSAFLAVLGYLFPSALGIGFLDPHILLAYACSGPFFVSSVAVESFSSKDEDVSPKTALVGKLLATTAIGWASAVLALMLGFLAVKMRIGSAVWPDARFLAGVLALGLSLAFFTSVAAAVLCLYISPPHGAKVLLRRAFFIALIAVVLLARYGEVEWKDSFSELLLPESILRIALGGMVAFCLLSAAGLVLALRHERYRASTIQS
jgi:hypothetical protein